MIETEKIPGEILFINTYLPDDKKLSPRLLCVLFVLFSLRDKRTNTCKTTLEDLKSLTDSRHKGAQQYDPRHIERVGLIKIIEKKQHGHLLIDLTPCLSIKERIEKITSKEESIYKRIEKNFPRNILTKQKIIKIKEYEVSVEINGSSALIKIPNTIKIPEYTYEKELFVESSLFCPISKRTLSVKMPIKDPSWSLPSLTIFSLIIIKTIRENNESATKRRKITEKIKIKNNIILFSIFLEEKEGVWNCSMRLEENYSDFLEQASLT